MFRYIPAPLPPRKTSKSEETRLAVNKRLREAIRTIADKRNMKIGDVIWSAVVDYWVLRMDKLSDLHRILSPDEKLNEDTTSYVGLGISDAEEWDKRTLDERAMFILADAGFNPEFHKRCLRAMAHYDMEAKKFLKMSNKELEAEIARIEKHERHEIDTNLLLILKAILENRQS